MAYTPEDVFDTTIARSNETFKVDGISEMNQKFVRNFIRAVKLSGTKMRMTINNLEVATFLLLMLEQILISSQRMTSSSS